MGHVRGQELESEGTSSISGLGSGTEYPDLNFNQRICI